MKEFSCRLRFHTPAFLGDADQNGAWRTPPIKALLRQFWRMDYARRAGWKVDIERMRDEEGALFGRAGDRDNSSKSFVRIRLSGWSQGKLREAPSIGTISIGKNRLPAVLYSGYGPVDKGPRLKKNAAIQAGESAGLRLAFPEGNHVEQALALAHRFGTLGGRSRNGWGSFGLVGELARIEVPLRDWKDAMQLDWPHALGRDESGPLLWESAPQARWEDAMRMLAQTRADLRRNATDRLVLAHPDTKRTMPGWEKDDRVPNSLRFKVRAEGSHYVASVFHMPCRPAQQLWDKLRAEKQDDFLTGFAAAHAWMDRQSGYSRVEP